MKTATHRRVTSLRKRRICNLVPVHLALIAAPAFAQGEEGSGMAIGGVVGSSILVGYVLPLLDISIGGTVGSFAAALVGAVVLILIVRLIRKAPN